MKNYISVNTKLPKLKEPVLCIVKASCECDHYIPAILARVNVTDDTWQWLADNPESGKYVSINKEQVVAWQHIEDFPKKYTEGFDR